MSGLDGVSPPWVPPALRCGSLFSMSMPGGWGDLVLFLFSCGSAPSSRPELVIRCQNLLSVLRSMGGAAHLIWGILDKPDETFSSVQPYDMYPSLPAKQHPVIITPSSNFRELRFINPASNRAQNTKLLRTTLTFQGLNTAI